MKVKGTVALVTGGAQGIGRAICEVLAEAGGKVCVADIDEAKGKQTADDLRKQNETCDAIFVYCDVTSSDSFSGAFAVAKEKFGYVDILVNNAGILNEHNWRTMLNINLAGVIEGTHLALTHMGKDKGGRGGTVVQLASAAGLFACPEFPVYATTKAAVLHLTAGYADEFHYSRHGVRLNSICPSFVATSLIENMEEKSFIANMEDQLRMYPQIRPELVAMAALELITDERPGGVCGPCRATVCEPTAGSGSVGLFDTIIWTDIDFSWVDQ